MMRRTRLVLIIGDIVVLLLFVLVGEWDHSIVTPQNPLGNLLVTGPDFVVPWLVVGWLAGAFPNSDEIDPRALLARTLNTWLIAAPLGVILRAILQDRAVIPTVFIVAALCFGGLFVFAWRIAFLLFWRRSGRVSAAPAPH